MTNYTNILHRTGEMAQQLRTLATLLEDQCLTSNTYMVANNYLYSSPESNTIFWPLGALHTCARTHAGKTPTV